MRDRRNFLAAFATLGLTGTLMPGVLWAAAGSDKKVTREMIDNAAQIADITISDDSKDILLEQLNSSREGYEAIRKLQLTNDIPPATIFDPVLPGMQLDSERRPARLSPAPHVRGKDVVKDVNELAFHSVRDLAELVRTRRVTSSALTEMYLERLRR